MSKYSSREGRTFIFIVALLSLLLIIGAIWAINSFRDSNKENVQALYKDFSRLEQAYSNEIRNIDEDLIPYQNPDSLRLILLSKRNAIKEKLAAIENKDKQSEVIQNLRQYQADKRAYSEILAKVYKSKDNYAVSEIASLKAELKKNRARIEGLLSQIKSYKSQLYASNKKLKLSEAQKKKLRLQKANLEKLLSEQKTSIAQLTSDLGEDRSKLRELLTQSEELIERQKVEIERLKGLTRRAYNFTAQYDFMKRRVILDQTGKHKGKVGKEIHLEFEVGESLFEADAQERIVFLTLYRNGKPYKIVKRPIPVLENGRTQAQIFVDKNLEDGDYYFDLTYQEASILDPYKFRIR